MEIKILTMGGFVRMEIMHMKRNLDYKGMDGYPPRGLRMIHDISVT